MECSEFLKVSSLCKVNSEPNGVTSISRIIRIVCSKILFTHLHTYGQVILFDSLKVQRVVDFDICVSESVFVPGLQVEGVVLVGLVSRASDQMVKHCRVALDPRAVWRTIDKDNYFSNLEVIQIRYGF